MTAMKSFAEFKKFAREHKAVIQALPRDKNGNPERQAFERLVVNSPLFATAIAALLASVCAITYDETPEEINKPRGPQ